MLCRHFFSKIFYNSNLNVSKDFINSVSDKPKGKINEGSAFQHNDFCFIKLLITS